MDNQSAAEKAGFTGEGFTGEGFTGQPAQGGGAGGGGGGGAGAGGAGAGGGDLGDLDGGDYDDLAVDPLMGEGTDKKSAKGMLIVVLVVGLAAGSLFSMHTLTKVSAAKGRNNEIDKTVDKFLNSMAGTGNPDNPDGAPDLVAGHSEILDSLTHDYMENQVTLDRDPFALSGGGGGGGGGGDPGLSRSAVNRAFEKLDLKSVIGGSRPLANINGKIVRVNQVMPVRLSKVEGEIKFRVKEITRDSVTVEAVGIELDEPFVKKIVLKRRRR